ncbi:hypothetical protein [Halopenitus sp. POP-27]|uniref:hypothetical protein n=1 Tax=Halopenitus sp. POP-27 TaxID=2994425 RepID=UPI002468E9DF|nr:hypothetical protein [Halopenitus sp. POP-27]
MPIPRRRALQLAGTATAVALAGCSLPDRLGSSPPATEYTLRVDRLDESPTAAAIYEPDDAPLFGDPARAAIEAILPDGRYTTVGYEPIPEDVYLRHDPTGTYQQTTNVVTGRRRIDRTFVRLSPVEDVDEDDETPIVVDTLNRPDARVLTILYSNVVAGGTGGAAELLRGDAYVLRRPAEREGRLASGDLDGHVVTLDAESSRAYRVQTSTETIHEPAITTLAVPVADSRAAFRQVVLETRVDAVIDRSTLPAAASDLLDRTVSREEYTEKAPRSEAFETLLSELGIADVESSINGRILWDGRQRYRYALYVAEPE